MAGLNRTHVSDLRGAVRMVVDASAGGRGAWESAGQAASKCGVAVAGTMVSARVGVGVSVGGAGVGVSGRIIRVA